jgi:hypothetical protein
MGKIDTCGKSVEKRKSVRRFFHKQNDKFESGRAAQAKALALYSSQYNYCAPRRVK